MAEITNTYGYDENKYLFSSSSFLATNLQIIFFGIENSILISLDSSEVNNFFINGNPAVLVQFGNESLPNTVFAKNPTFAGATIDAVGYSSAATYQFWS